MDAWEVLLKEWEQRYQSYREYRTQYLTVLSAAATAAILAAGYSLLAEGLLLRAILAGAVCIVLLVLTVAHHIVRPFMNKLGRRLASLEAKLGFEPFDTSAPLEAALRASHIVSWVGIVLALVHLLGVLLSGP